MPVSDGILLCDKPAGWSSHRVVSVLRKAFGTSRVGHAGTLDPMATGLLVVAIGEGLKILRYLTLDDKSYRATVRLGVETDTLDADGRELGRAAVPAGLDVGLVVQACAAFRGVIAQDPPAISAIKQAGVPLYKRARRGEQVVVAARQVRVDAIEVEAVRADEIDLRVDSGKGFYVRSLARDLALALGTVGHLTALRRLRSGAFDVSNALAIDERLRTAADDPELRAALGARLLPIECALSAAPVLVLDAAGAEHARQGRSFSLDHVLSGCPDGLQSEPGPIEPLLLRGEHGCPLALARCSNATLTIVRGLRLQAPN